MERVMTILEGEVSEENWETLKQAFNDVQKMDFIKPAESFLVQSKDKPTMWKLVGIWDSLETFQKMRETVETPPGIMVFKKAGVEVSPNLFNIVDVL